jgi:2',3'-cyclic-nucleotide 2'-phosphodiesterase (5'-nucleotidase family)
MLCANVVNKISKKLQLTSYKTYMVQGVRIGVTSILGKEAWDVTPISTREDLQLLDPIQTAKEVAVTMRKQDKCDILILLSHSGANRGDRELAQQGYYDIIFAGHEHHYDCEKAMSL